MVELVKRKGEEVMGVLTATGSDFWDWLWNLLGGKNEE